MVTRQTVTVPAFGVAGRHAAAWHWVLLRGAWANLRAPNHSDYGSQRAAKIAKVTKIAKGDLGFRPARHFASRNRPVSTADAANVRRKLQGDNARLRRARLNEAP